MVLEWQTVLSVFGGISTIVGTYFVIMRIRLSNKQEKQKEKDTEKAAILQTVKEEIAAFVSDLEGKINLLKSDTQNLEENTGKDLQHLKETYNGEIKDLGQKIENLRSDLRHQHTQMIQLLTKLIDNKD